jgi:NADP-dependent 3-hydroxy acid dehydrogenase YdfG
MNSLKLGRKRKVTMKTSKNETPVVVIVGASSGNGEAAALEFAKEGAKLVIAARGSPTLSNVLLECKNLGAEVIAVTVDTTIP